ncbi:Gfo/Idh/MocA family protein [Paenibacillus sacheonensis]|uniref:Gfo/Idh/MocA family oxidoreductase n=1 Tax=Paenibacillus sacheonensis TaxID=742054 RepID=A0A7X4YT29_9BACL|nr:Gfo/Idh/MocA family oxidoreductase [Paenibacillus sacheonensis]MBM7568356.1 putative dehydrogenase [Paenibacillus sacheonensis]NBC72056.1 Gfo/Idh/MocA family oxidoreductase [Paenibacillus sacheonensis]
MTTFKIALAGCGGMANHWVEYALQRPDTEIVALMDIFPEQATRMAERHGLTCGTYTDLAEAIRESKANLVFDVTIPAARYDVCMTALANGCDVLSEKPMAVSLTEAQDMIRAADANARAYAVMQNRRFHPSIRAYRDLIAEGKIGKVGHLQADFYIGAHFGGFRDTMDSPLLLDMAIHTFDQARFILGADPVSVYCHEFNPPGSWYAGNASAICIYEMSDGSVFCYQGSWCAEGANTSWEANWRAVGSQGTALWDGSDGPPAADIVAAGQEPNFTLRTERETPGLTYAGKTGHYGCFDEMFAALQEGRRAETDCHDNIKSIAMVLGALESARTGTKIDLSRI